jgi:HD-like signal output (HDOD) protein
MEIRCPHCSKAYVIDDKRKAALKDAISMPCPNCKGLIPISPGTGSDGQAASSPTDKMVHDSRESLPTGEDQVDVSSLKERILGSLKDLPPMPQVAQRARQIISNPASSFSDLAKVIETDQAIVTRILKIANSSYYGLSGKVSSVQHAAVVLGSKTLMEMLTLACSSEILGRTLEGYNLDAGELWMHSLAVAAGSQIIARRVRPELEQDAFSAGLIHDVGKIILEPYIQKRKGDFRAFVNEGKETFLNAEKHILGFDHAELASEACQKWKIPTKITQAIRYHHDPTPSKGDVLSFIVHTADAVAIMSGIGAGLDGMLYTLHPDALSLLKLKAEDLSTFMGQIAEFVEKTAQEF